MNRFICNAVKNVAIVVFVVLWSQQQALGQTDLPSVIPPSPNASSLGKFADIPVGLYNGIPSISVPIYEVNVNNLKLPISLDYHAGGIKVTEIPSLVGLGWALNAGGLITRSIHGNPDEANNGYVNGVYYGAIPAGSQCLSGNDANNYGIATAVSKTNDTEPDIFYYNFAGLSGSFVLDKNRNAHLIPYSKIKIEPTNSSLQGWKITGEDGIQYYFTMGEQSATTPGSSGFITSSWYLTQIAFPNSSETISFSYDFENLAYDLPMSETRYQLISAPTDVICPAPTLSNLNPRINSRTAINNSPRLSKITFPGGSVDFIAGNYRYDLTGQRVLKQIRINNTTSAIKIFNLAYNYFNAGVNNIEDSGTATATTSANTTLRLCLKSVQEASGDNSIVKPPHVFSYYTPNVVDAPYLPDRLTSNAQDHWGFYNGQNSNTTLIPTYVDANNTVQNGAMRQASAEYAKTGVLNSITYPTGGSMTLEYELNDAESDYLPNNLQSFNAYYTVGSCHTGNSGNFVIANATSNSTTVKLKLTGSPYTLSALNCSGSSSLPNASDPSSLIYFQVLDVTNATAPQVVYTSSAGMTIGTATQEGNVSINLPNGTYRIKAVKGNSNLTASAAEITTVNANFYGAFNFTATGYFSVTGAKLVGGLRVRKITTYDPVSNKNTYKIYQYNDGALSSGRVNYIPNYHYTYTEKGACKPDGSPANAPYTIQTFVFDVASSFSNSPLTQMKGSVVGYGKVTVMDGEELNGLVSPNGKTENFFTNPVDNVPYAPSDGALNFCYLNTFTPGQNQYPFAPSISLDFERGLLTDQIVYKSQNNTYVKVKETVNNYKSDYFGTDAYANSTTDVIGAKVGISYRTYGNIAPYYIFPTQYYFIPSRVAKLVNTDEIAYDNSGNQFHNVTQYAYDNTNHFQLSRSIHLRSDSVAETTQYLYPLDYSNSSGFIADMKNANILSSPIETVRFQTAKDNSVTVTGAQLKNYKASTQVGLLDKIYKIESVQPIPLSQFKFSNQSVTGSLPSSGTIASYGADSKYPAIPYFSLTYDNVSSKLINTQERLVKNISYQWGYNQQYPVAEAKNATSTNIFYESFEEGAGNSALNDSKTGHFSFATGTYAKTLTGLSAGNYLLTYWSKSNGTWSQVVTPVTVSGTSYPISLLAPIDDVRFYPATAQMTTYTYDPQIGVTSITDPKGVPSFYEYDSFQRLINIKDKDGYIVKHFDYHYSGQ